MPIPLNVKMIKAVVFDLDNTLVSSQINFQHLREQIGCPKNQDLLTFADALPSEAEQQQAHQQILDHELSDATSAAPMKGCLSLLNYLKESEYHLGIVTRNCETATEMKLEHCEISIERVVSREEFAPKPEPDALLALQQEWQLESWQLLYVGDYLYDLEAAENAQMPSCLVTNGLDKPFRHQASIVVDNLEELQTLFAKQC
ncbi:HAD family hydrolase [Vibrio profundi]|uniref:HAD family hydrolase n=1 Tax=Vibrio profundi TaxID=1774960 RepID=UPI0037365D8D